MAMAVNMASGQTYVASAMTRRHMMNIQHYGPDQKPRKRPGTGLFCGFPAQNAEQEVRRARALRPWIRTFWERRKQANPTFLAPSLGLLRPRAHLDGAEAGLDSRLHG